MTRSRFIRHERRDLGHCGDGCAGIRAFRDTGLVVRGEGSRRARALSWRDTIVLEVQSERHGKQTMHLSVVELDTLWRLIGRAMKWRRGS